MQLLILLYSMTASQLEASLEVSGSRAAQLFAARSNYTWIIYYDQNTGLSPTANLSTSSLLHQLHRILSEESSEKSLKHEPQWLMGGYESWQSYVKKSAVGMPVTQDETNDEFRPACVAGDENDKCLFHSRQTVQIIWNGWTS
ncbi:hypothetical protein BDF19DRAFT_271218 [Syncephalis fuscata]|nr:hypothetical protein BDF19DRAFT_271218 [Syncephalis fuscata]